MKVGDVSEPVKIEPAKVEETEFIAEQPQVGVERLQPRAEKQQRVEKTASRKKPAQKKNSPKNNGQIEGKKIEKSSSDKLNKTVKK